MNTKEVDRIFAVTLKDGRLSRSEKQALKKVFAELRPDHRMRAVYRRRAFEAAAEAMGARKSRLALDWLDEILRIVEPGTKPPKEAVRSEALFSPDDNICQYLKGLLDGSGQAIDICVFTITDDRITSSILRAHRRKVPVRIISDNDKAFDAGSDISGLKRAGIPVVVDRDRNHMHHKFALFDRRILVTGSYNWTRSASHSNRENFVVTGDPKLVGKFQEEFERLWLVFR